MIDINHLLQSDIWKRSKINQGYEIFETSKAWGTISKVPILGFRIGYMSRPVVDDQLLEELQEIGNKKKLSHIQIDPVNKEELDKNLVPTKPVQLRKTYIVKLGFSEDEFLSDMKRKDRYYIRKGEKDGLTTYFRTDKESFNKFSNLYEATMKRHKVAPRGYKYLEAVFDAAKDNLVIAQTYFQDELLVSSFIIKHDSVAYYLYTGSSEKQKNLRASFFHVWNCLKWANSGGLEIFDMFGIDEDEKKGFSNFKFKFIGEVFEYTDSFDLIVDSSKYKLIKLLIKLRELVS